MNWDESIVPVRTYVLNVTDTRQWSDSPSRGRSHVGYQAEYNVAPCSAGSPPSECIDTQEAHKAKHEESLSENIDGIRKKGQVIWTQMNEFDG